MPITGPKVQAPAWQAQFVSTDGTLLLPAVTFLHSVQQTVFNITRSGPTASRPTSDLDGRFIGMPYFDTTLGFQINLQSVNPDVWVNSAGAPV